MNRDTLVGPGHEVEEQPHLGEVGREDREYLAKTFSLNIYTSYFQNRDLNH